MKVEVHKPAKPLFGILIAGAALLFALAGETKARAELQPLSSSPSLVVDASNGKIYARNRIFTRWAPASLTKLMTAYSVFRALKPQHLAMNSPVRISEEALAQPPSKMGFPIGTILTIESALKIIMVKSANDVSVALGEAVAGSEAEFVRFMNSHAKRLGMRDTNFTNPHGLHDPLQYTTARDMALLAIALGDEFPQFADMFDIPALKVGRRRLRNHNALLRLFAGTNGMKTGYVCASGFNVIVRTKREDRELIAVVLGQASGFKRSVAAAELLTEAFEKSATAFRPTLATIIEPVGVSDIPVDITRRICPGKYPERVVPDARPSEVQSPQEFDGIDAQVLIERAEAAANPLRNLPIPEKRPFYNFTAATAALGSTKVSTEIASKKERAKPANKPSLKERAKKLLKPRDDLRADVRVTLGGATGPNPFAVKHTNGSVYKSGTPIPTKRPALDLKATEE